MGLFGLGKKDKVIDLTEQFNTQTISPSSERIVSEVSSSAASSSSESASGGLGFLGAIANSVSDSTSAVSGGTSATSDLEFTGTVEDKRKKLAKRLMDITDKLEDLSNQIYRVQQRLEVLERKADIF